MRARLASGNLGKLVELRQALPGWEIELLAERDFPSETGSTYAENARGKALYARAHAAAGEWALGEDSGIEVAALDRRPGVASARWAQDGVGNMLEELDGIVDRRARYVCVIVAIGPSGDELTLEGTLEGAISAAPRGHGGFGYDPIFVPAGEARTVAELGDDWKTRNSHRARAAAALAAAVGT